MALVSSLKLSVWTNLLIQQSTSVETPQLPVTCADLKDISIGKGYGGRTRKSFDLSHYQQSDDSIKWLACSASDSDFFNCEFTADSITFGNSLLQPLWVLIGKDIDDLRDPNINHYISQSDTRGIATLFADDKSAQQLCNQMGYQTGSIEDSYWNVECSAVKWSGSEWIFVAKDNDDKVATSITCRRFLVPQGYSRVNQKEMAIPVAEVDSGGNKIDTKDQVGIPRLMEAISYLDFRQKVIDGFPSEKNRNYTFIIRAAAPYTIEYMDEESLRRINNGKYGHTSMLTEKERDDTNKASEGKRKKVVLFAGGFCVDRHGKICKWDCQSGHFNPGKMVKNPKKWVPTDKGTRDKLWESAPVIARVFGFPTDYRMKCKNPKKSSSISTMDYWNEHGDDAFDDDRLFAEYDRIITDYLLSQMARDKLKTAPWAVALTGKDLITLLLMAVNVVTIMTVCCAFARTKRYGKTNYKAVRTVGDSEMDSEEIELQQ